MFAFPEISDLLQPGQTATDLADHLLQTAHVATVPGDAFDAPNHLRICFAVDDNTLDEAIERLTTPSPTRPRTRPQRS
jgi:aspartate aminotransferase